MTEFELNGRNFISAINSGAVSIATYGAIIISLTKIELDVLDRKKRKLMTMYGAQHAKADVDRLCLQRCEDGGGPIELENCEHVKTHSL